MIEPYLTINGLTFNSFYLSYSNRYMYFNSIEKIYNWANDMGFDKGTFKSLYLSISFYKHSTMIHENPFKRNSKEIKLTSSRKV